MDKPKVYKRITKDGKEQDVFRHNSIFNLKVSTDFIAPDYSVVVSNSNDMSNTGLLKLFDVATQDSAIPSFKARWDEKDDQIDIDIYNVGEGIVQEFKNGKGGYSGHHSQKTIDSPRTYLVEIKMPDKVIFSGNITFNINQGHAPNLFSS